MGRRVEWHTDNYAASLIFTKGSNKPDLQLLSETVYEVCRQNRVSVTVKWNPRTLLADVDALSRNVDYDDWEVQLPFFDFLNERWGPFTTDWFADHSNAKLKRFYSKYYCPETSGVNPFFIFLEGRKQLLDPPVY